MKSPKNLTFLFATALFLSTTTAFAQPPSQTNPQTTQPAEGSSGTNTQTENTQVQATLRTEGGRRVYVATGTIEVRGEIQRPYAFSVSSRASLGYTYLDASVSFVQEIIAALRRTPF